MIIDFHTHAFPDALAPRAVGQLAATAGLSPVHDGTAADLRRAMREGGVDRSVVLPVVTAPRQFESINRFAREQNGRDGLIFFGGIHPDNEEPERLLDGLKAAGLKGVKLHPDYQGVRLGDARYVRILRHCAAIGLIVVTHTGFDPLSPQDVHATVDEIERLLEGVCRGGLRPQLVLAHLGGEGQLDEVERRLCGAPLWLDTAHMLGRVPDEQVVRLCRRHGTDRVLFATDSPWDSPAAFTAKMRTLPFTAAEREAILGGNAVRLLGGDIKI